MVATVETELWTGGSDGSPTKTTSSTLRFRTDDSPTTADTTNPLNIPSSGLNYSYWVHLGLAISGTFTEVTNIRFHTDGAIGYTLGTQGQLQRGARDTGDQGVPETSYEVATGTLGDTGDAIDDGTNGHTYYNGQTTPTADTESDTSGSPATVDSSSITAAGSSKAVVLQCVVDTDATTGTQSNETLTFLYDEI